ncbi:MAG: hypothetical protein H0T79_10820 [Deltaproteobacteria bacterium]|nr:hypothetical protein [Deltaproteobacteria bacterium]
MAATSFVVPACSSDPVTTGDDDVGSGSGSGSGDEWDQLLNERVFDFNAALRIAALRLTGDLPTMQEINTVATAGDDAAKRLAYNALITDYMSRPAYARQMFYFWRDTFKLGDTAEMDAAPAFAAQISVENGSYTSLLTANAGNCPTFNETDATFTAAECTNNGPKAGVLSNPGVHKQFFGNFGFRRVKWIQETFDCAKFPAEISETAIDVGGPSPYTGTWPFTSISSPTNGGGRVNFQDVSAVICANCHTTMNHIAPLFAMYDLDGNYQQAISVPTPLEGAPPAMFSDYLPAGETTAWRFGVAAADIPAFGAAMAADPAIASCGVARMWNWALGKTDIVDTLQEVPAATIQSHVDSFTASGFKMKDLIYAIYTADDFVKF